MAVLDRYVLRCGRTVSPAFIGRVRPVGERDRVVQGSVPRAAYRGSQTDPACGHTSRASAGPTWQSGSALAWSAPVPTESTVSWPGARTGDVRDQAGAGRGAASPGSRRPGWGPR